MQRVPFVDMIFKQLARSAMGRSEGGKVALIIFDDTDKSIISKTFNSITEVDKAPFTATNIQYIKDVFEGVPNSVTVVRLDVAKTTIADALMVIKGMDIDWVGIAEASQAQNSDLVLWIKQMEKEGRAFKALVWNPTTAPDSKHIVNFGNVEVMFRDSRSKQPGNKAVSIILGYLAGTNVKKGTTYMEIKSLQFVKEPDNIQDEVSNGKLILFNSGGKVKIKLGVNSLTTINAVDTEDMQKIEVVEVMDLINGDIKDVFFNSWVGNFKNNTDNTFLFITAINSYLKELEKQEILDDKYNNTSFIDIASQKDAWISAGKTEALTWDDTKVKNMSFKNLMFIGLDIKVNQTLEGLKCTVGLF